MKNQDIEAVDYLNPVIEPGLKLQDIPVVDANDSSLSGYGVLIDSPDDVDFEIVRWPALGWRPVDPDTGDEAGTTEGIFSCRWRGDVLYGSNAAVGGHYILGYAEEPARASEEHAAPPSQLLLWHANYHPDGGQLFWPRVAKPFLVPLALPGDDVKPGDFVCFRFDGTKGLYIHPNIWHEGVFPIKGDHEFFDRQGRVHARVSVDFPKEFGCLLRVDLDSRKPSREVSSNTP